MLRSSWFRYPQLPGVPCGTCWPSQLQGIMVRQAVKAHCCWGVSGLPPAHWGVSGVPQIGGSAWPGGAAPIKPYKTAAATIASPATTL